jgi:methyltransferase
VTSRTAYTLLVALVALERLVETAVSRRNVRRALARGGVEAGRSDYPWMVALHGGFLAACVLEVRVLDRPWIPLLGLPMLLVVGAGMAVRYWVVASLDGRWTTRVVYVPGDPIVTGGPFRWMRHPNYAAVVAEVAAIPLVHTAWITAVVFSTANAWLLGRRIRVENQLLASLASGPTEGSRRARIG